MPTPPMPGWKLPVAVGIFWPICSVAFCPWMARNCGSWISCVLLSLRMALSVALGMVTEKLWLFRCVNSFRVGELVVEVGVVEVPLVLLVLLLLVVVLDCGACSPMLKLLGG